MATASGPSKGRKIAINRAPVLTLWAAVVAERLGYDRAAALTLGRAVAGLNAQSKGRRLGIFPEPPPGEAKKPRPAARAGTTLTVELLHRAVPALKTKEGVRALGKDGKAESPESVERYLAARFGDALEDARRSMRALAASLAPRELAQRAFALYEGFRPEVPEGAAGWGAKGVLDLDRVRPAPRPRAR